MVAVRESGNPVIVDVNQDVVQEDSNYQLGDASGNQPSSETQDVNPLEAEEDAVHSELSKLKGKKIRASIKGFKSQEIQIFPYMAAVPESGNSVVVGVNPEVVQKNSDNQLGDAGNQTNSVTLEIEEDSNYQLGDASGNQPSSETQDVNPIVANEDAGNQLNSIDYYKATKGDFHAFEKIDADSRTQLVTRVDKKTILHICRTAATPYYRKKTARTESVEFVNKALAKCKELLWQPNKKGETILHIAARHGHHDIVQVLLTEDRGARHNGQAINRPQPLLEMKNEVGDTALHEAVRYTHLQVVKLLISEDRHYQYGQNNDGETPLYIAAEMGARDHNVVQGAREVVKEILKCESPAYHGPYGRTALHAAVLCNDDGIVGELCEKFKELITREADNSGWTPLHFAAQNGFASIVKLLLEKDKNAAYMGDKNENKTALHVAASEGKAEVVEQFMLTCPDCFEQVDEKGQNVLHFAAEASGNKDATLRLILGNECFSNLINAKDKSGDTPLHHLVYSNYPFALDLIFHRKLNARVFNKKNLSPVEVIFYPTADDSMGMVFGSIALKAVDKTASRQIRHKEKVNKGGDVADVEKKEEGGSIEDQDGIKKDESDQREGGVRKNRRKPVIYWLQELKEINLVIAILISTVTFAAGFTIPGGYTSGNSPNEAGYPVLIRKPAFKVFVFSNTIAFILASTAVLLHLTWRMYKKVSTIASQTSLWCNLLAMTAMAVAFVSGTCAVLTPNPSIVVAICVLSALLFALTFSPQILDFIYFRVPISRKVRAYRQLLSERVGSK